jgi:hypothetical protein
MTQPSTSAPVDLDAEVRALGDELRRLPFVVAVNATMSEYEENVATVGVVIVEDGDSANFIETSGTISDWHGRLVRYLSVDVRIGFVEDGEMPWWWDQDGH